MVDETYLTNDEWAVLRGYANFAAYTLKEPFPPAATLTRYRLTAAANMNEQIGVSSCITTTNWLKGVEERAIAWQIDEEQARQANEAPPPFMPHDYLGTNVRYRLKQKNPTSSPRGVSN